MYFIDTNIFLRFIADRQSPFHGDCKKLIFNIHNNKIKAVTSSLVFAEFAWALKSFYKFSKGDIVDSLLTLQNLAGLKIVDDVDIKKGTAFYKIFNVKYIDALIASAKNIYEKKWIVISYDKDFDKLGVNRKEPVDIIK